MMDGRAASGRPAFFLGTPFVTNRRDELRKSQVLDAQGRSRFHGAFEGGFSAGYFNTVGSAEGWTPSQFVRGAAQRTAEDFMDEEDDALLGDRLTARESFVSASPAGETEELFSSSDVASSSASLASIGKRLLAMCVDKEARRERFLQDEQKIRKRAPLMVRHQGLGLLVKEAPHTLSAAADDRHASEWRSSKLALSATVAGELDDEEHLSRRVNQQEGLSFYEVDVTEKVADARPRQEDRIKALEAKLSRFSSSKSSKARWPNGTLLPNDCVRALNHDPKRLLNEKKSIATSIPGEVSPFHEFGSSRPPSRMEPRPGASTFSTGAAVSSSGLSERFVRSNFFNRQDDAKNATGELEFRRTVSTWIPNAATLKLFGVDQAAIKSGSIKADESQAAVATADVEGRAVPEPSLEDLRRVFQPPHIAANEPEFVHSDDEEVDSAVLEARKAADSNQVTSSDAAELNHPKRRKSEQKKRKKKKKSSKRRKRDKDSSPPRSSVSSLLSSTSSSSDEAFVMDLS